MTSDTSHVRLVPFQANHFESLMSWLRSEREFVQWTGTGFSFPLNQAQCEAIVASTQDTPPLREAFTALQDNLPLGHGEIAYDWENGVARLARIVVAPAARRRKLSRPMLELLVRRAFSHPEIERLELNVISFNIPALRAYARLGFVQEGTRRSCMKVGEERWDNVLMGLLRSEWTG